MKQLCLSVFASILLFFNPGLSAWGASVKEVKVPPKLMKKLKSFEPSAIIFVKELDSYLVSSDDTDKKETPLLFLMNDQGEINQRPLRVQGLKAMTDIESLSQDGSGFLYLLSSLSLNKNGEERESRNIFVQVQFDEDSLHVVNQVDLRSVLIKAVKTSRVPEIKSLSRNIERDLDIEAHFVLQGRLYVGIKNPQPFQNQALILDLGLIELLFKEQSLETLSIWRKVDFSSVGAECLLSDMAIDGNELYLSTTSDSGSAGRLWHMNLSSGALSELKSYKGLKPEGLALKDEKSLMVVFDQGAKPGAWTVESISSRY